MLWLANSETLYIATTEYALKAKDPSYKDLIAFLGYEDSATPDGVQWLDDSYNYDELTEYVIDFIR